MAAEEGGVLKPLLAAVRRVLECYESLRVKGWLRSATQKNATRVVLSLSNRLELAEKARFVCHITKRYVLHGFFSQSFRVVTPRLCSLHWSLRWWR